MVSTQQLQPSSTVPVIEDFLESVIGPLLDHSRLGQPGLGIAFYEGEQLDPRWKSTLEAWGKERGLFVEHSLLADLGESPTARLISRQRVGEHLFSIEISPEELADAALRQTTPVTNLNIHRDTFRDKNLVLLLWVPTSRARRFMDLASNLVDYRTVEGDVPAYPAEVGGQPGPLGLPAPQVARHNLAIAPLGKGFVGREKELAQLAETLRERGASAITDPLAVEGLGGIGKTRLALEYAWRHLADYDDVYLVRADTIETLRSELSRLSSEWLKLPIAEGAPEAVRVSAVLEWFERHTRWLLIIDNADSEPVAEYITDKILPSLRGGHVLMTSRYRRWGGEVRGLVLDSLAEPEGIRLLLAGTELDRRGKADDPEVAAELVRALGHLPLAIEQMAAWVRARHGTLAEALAAVQSESQAVLSWFDEKEVKYPRSIAATWELSVEARTPAEQFLLRFFAWLSSSPVPEFVTMKVATIWTEGDPPDFLAVARSLAERSLINARSDRSHQLHRLCQELERRRTPREERMLWTRRVAQVLSAATDGNPQDVRTWPRLLLLLPHVNELFQRTEPPDPATPWTDPDQSFLDALSFLLNQFGRLAHNKAEFKEAEPLLRRALAIEEQSYGAEHPNVAIRLNNLAALLQATNRLAEAEPLMRRALAIDEQSYGAEHPKVALRLWVLAVLLRATERLTEAVPLMRRAISIYHHFATHNGHEHPHWNHALSHYRGMLEATGLSKRDVNAAIRELMPNAKP